MDISRDKQEKISRKKTRTRLRKRSHERETESLLRAPQKNGIRTYYFEAKIDKMPRNSRGMLCGDKKETINHIISECSKLM